MLSRNIAVILIMVFFPMVEVLALPGEQNTVQLKGKLIQGGLLQGHTVAGATVKFQGKTIPVSANGGFLLGLGRDEPEKVVLEVQFSDGRKVQKNLKITQRQYKIQRIEGLPQRKVTPKKQDIERIRADVVQVKRARKRMDAREDYAQGFIWPTKGPISGVYGSQRILNGKPKQPHYGVDVAVPVGTAVLAPADGIITLAEQDLFYSGGTVILDHGYGLSSSFLHLSKILVKTGAAVKQGDLIARVGKTGRATGAHLDWRMNWLSKRIDPQLLMQQVLWQKKSGK